MTAQPGFKIPVNDVVAGGGLDRELYFIGATATAAKCLPGILVKQGATGAEVIECDASGNEIGYLDYMGTPAEFRPETITTAYARGDQVGVRRGAGRRQMGYLASGQNVANGDPLKRAADGQLTAATVGTDDVVADAAQAVNASAGVKTIWVITRK